MQNRPITLAVASGILGVLSFILFVLTWGLTPPSNPSAWNTVLMLMAAGLAATALVLGRRAEKYTAGVRPPGKTTGYVKFWLRLGKVGSLIVLAWWLLEMIGLFISHITPAGI